MNEYHQYLAENTHDKENESKLSEYGELEGIKSIQAEPTLIKALNKKKRIVAGQKFNRLPDYEIWSGNNDIAINLNSNIIEIEKPWTKVELFIYQLPFGFYYLAQDTWTRIHIIVSSFYFSRHEQGALNAFFFGYDFLHNFSLGIAAVVASNVSGYMAQGKVHAAKKYVLIASSAALFIGITFNILVYTFSEKIAWFLIKDKEAINLLIVILEKYAFLIPCEIFTAVLFGIVRSIGRIKHACVALVICYYLVYFAVYFY